MVMPVVVCAACLVLHCARTHLISVRRIIMRSRTQNFKRQQSNISRVTAVSHIIFSYIYEVTILVDGTISFIAMASSI